MSVRGISPKDLAWGDPSRGLSAPRFGMTQGRFRMNCMRSLALFLLGASVLPGTPAFMTGQQSMPVAELVLQFKANPIFWQQFEVAEKLARSHDPAVLAQLEPYLKDDDRHVRAGTPRLYLRPQGTTGDLR